MKCTKARLVHDQIALVYNKIRVQFGRAGALVESPVPDRWDVAQQAHVGTVRTQYVSGVNDKNLKGTRSSRELDDYGKSLEAKFGSFDKTALHVHVDERCPRNRQ